MTDLAVLQNALRREREARNAAERLLESRSIELYRVLNQLRDQTDRLTRDQHQRQYMLFTHSPAAIVEVDGSPIRDLIRRFHRVEKSERRAWFDDHLDELCARVAQCRIKAANPAMVALLRADSEEQLLNQQSLFFDRAYVRDLARYGFHMFTDRADVGLETQIATGTGQRLDVRLHACVPPFGEQSLDSILCTFIDISAAKAVQAELIAARKQAEHHAREREHWVAKVNHELRNPVHAILEFARQLATSSHMDETERRKARTIHESAHQLKRLMDDLQCADESGRAQLTLEKRPFELDWFCNSIEQAWAVSFAAKGVDLWINCHDRHLVATTDAHRLRQIVDNLLTNALRHTDRGGVTVTILQREDRLGIRVMDTGCGFSEEMLDNLEAAKNEDQPLSAASGEGLGLSIVRAILQAMGGKYQIQNTPSGGASVCIEVPAFDVAAHAFPQPDDAIEADKLSPSRDVPLRILAAEDSALGRRVLSAMLEVLGADLTIVGDGAAAIEMAHLQTFDIILLDVLLPGLDGLEACRTIRSGAGPNRLTPIIGLTGNATREDRRRLLDAGMNDVLLKPVDGPAIARLLDQWAGDTEMPRGQSATA